VRSFSEFLARGALRAAVVVLPPTFLSGMALPLAARGVARSRERIGVDVGALYAVNTAGSILGALVAGLWLLPAIGAVRSLVVLAAWNAAAGAVVLLSASRDKRGSALAAGAAAACLAALLVSPEPLLDAFLRSSIGREKIGQVLLFREGATDTIAIVRKDYGFHDENAKSLITNGVAMSATVRPVRRYMSVEGHLPVLLANDPSRALVICLGTGITLGAVAAHPEVASIDAVELSEGVIEGLPLFAAENGEPYRDPRVRIVREDGRHFLETSRDRYGVITLEPPPPIVAGASHLYSLDFYEVCKRHLAPGGVVAQWLPLHAQSLASAKMTARTFLEAFPSAQLWLPSVRDAVLVGSETPLTLSLERVRAAYAEPETRASLAAALLESPEALLGTFLLDRDGISRWAAGAPILTDEHPRMEFFRAAGTNMSEAEIATLLPSGPTSWSFIEGGSSDPAFPDRVDTEARALRLYMRAETSGDPHAGLEAARLSRGTEFLLYPLGCTTEQLESLRRSGTREAILRQEARCAAVH
jgi:spermidine synthase